MKSDGGVQQTGVSSVQACQDKCVQTSTCVGFDWNRADSTCWFHSNVDTMKNNQQSDSNVDQYQRDGCAGGSGGNLANIH